MRKFSLLLVALLVVTTGAFAQVSIEPEIEVDASATWGVNLDEETHGFKNEANSTLSFVFTEEQNEEFGEGDVYGWILLEEFKIEFEVDGDADGTTDPAPHFVVTNGEMSARLMLGPVAYIDILSAPDEVDKASNFSKIAQNIRTVGDSLAAIGGPADANVADTTAYAGKTALGFDVPDLMVLELGIFSNGDWDANTGNEYLLSLDADIVAVPNLTINPVAMMRFNEDDAGTEAGPASVGIGFEYTLPVTADVTAAPEVGFDYSSLDVDGDAYNRLEVGLGVNLTWAGLGTDEDDETIFGVEDELTSGVGLGFTYGIHDVGYLVGVGAVAPADFPAPDVEESVNTLGVKLGLYEDGGDDGLFPVVGGAVLLNYNAISGLEDALGVGEDSYSELGLGLEVDADLDVVSPFAGLTFLITDIADNFDSNESYAYLNLGTDINVVANTTFTVEYKSGELNADTAGADVLYGAGYAASTRESGQVALTTKIEF